MTFVFGVYIYNSRQLRTYACAMCIAKVIVIGGAYSCTYSSIHTPNLYGLGVHMWYHIFDN